MWHRVKYIFFSFLLFFLAGYIYAAYIVSLGFLYVYKVCGGPGDVSVIHVLNMDEYRAVSQVLEARGTPYVKWPSGIIGGSLDYCGNVFEDVEVQSALGGLEGKQVQLYTTRFLFFPSFTPWYGAENFVRKEGWLYAMREYYSASTALVVAVMASLASVYIAWMLGRAGKLWHFAVPYAVGFAFPVASSALYVLASTASFGASVSSLLLLLIILTPAVLMSVVFYLAWRRRMAE